MSAVPHDQEQRERETLYADIRSKLAQEHNWAAQEELWKENQRHWTQQQRWWTFNKTALVLAALFAGARFLPEIIAAWRAL